VCHCIVHGVKAVHIRADSHRFFLDAGINLRNRLNLGIHSLCCLIDIPHEVGQRLDPKIDPVAKILIRKISEF
jgi:hypothetical protein